VRVSDFFSFSHLEEQLIINSPQLISALGLILFKKYDHFKIRRQNRPNQVSCIGHSVLMEKHFPIIFS